MALDMLANSIGKTIQLERGGPDKVVGELVAVRSDHIVLRNEKYGVLYCATDHIKSVTESIVEDIEAPESAVAAVAAAVAAVVGNSQATAAQPTTPEIPIIPAQSMNELLTALEHTLIQVNHGGPNAVKGVLLDVGPSDITMVFEMKEYIYFPIFHIRSVSRIYHVKDDKQEGQAEGDKSDKNDKSDKSDKKNDAQGKK